MPKPNNRTRSTARVTDKEDNVSSMPTVYRRFPRIGSSFQTKVPSHVGDTYQPSRQIPVLLSKDFPDVARSDVMDEMMGYSGECSPNVALFPETESSGDAVGF